jgi:dynein heavy chain
VTRRVDAQWLTLILNFSYATTSEGLQEMIESRLDKRQGRRYGPTGAKARLVTFIDDLNMPRRTEFGSQPPNELLRQWIDYGNESLLSGCVTVA